MLRQGSAPSVTAVVVNHNGGEHVLQTMEALCGQSSPPASIILVDSGSDDGSPERVAAGYPDTVICRLPSNRGPAAARNKGLAVASTDLVLLLDVDIYPDRDCLARLLQAYQNERPSVVCPRILLLPEEDVVHCDGAEAHFLGTMSLRNGYRPLSEVSGEVRAPVRACGSACLLVDRLGVLQAGGFDELYFFYFEDLEFSIRLRASGHRLLWEPSAVVRHDRGEGTPGLSYRGARAYPARRAYLTLRNRLLTIGIHYRLWTILVLSPALALYEAATIFVCLQRGWGGQWLRAWAWQVRNVRRIMERRRRSQRARILRDREILAGGPVPLAPGFTSSRPQMAAVAVLSAALGAYWRLARHVIC